MKRCIIWVAALTLPLSAENLFRNGNMDTVGGWKGASKITTDESDEKGAKKPASIPGGGKPAEANRFLQVTAKLREPVVFSQEVNTKGLTDVMIKFRYRTKDYVGRGLEIRGIRASRDFTFISRTFVKDGEWHEMTWDFTKIMGSRNIDFIFSVLEGTGVVDFDDITVEPIIRH
ncbi:MAG: hypothetical protein H8M99_11955 [Gloeobacteraceae cyanobacterium ES-bin-144]|nr:hypothetical protein [Verrucomicrobiales bacterium]